VRGSGQAFEATDKAIPMHSASLDTPFLAVDLDVLSSNIESMAVLCSAGGISLRPHAKTHKSIELARMQLHAGATGLTVATVGEAEIFAAAGITDLFIAYPVWAGGERGRRLRQLADDCNLRLGVDSTEAAEVLGSALRGQAVEVLVEIDCGHHRSGVSIADVAAVGRAAEASGLTVRGVFTFPGHSYNPGHRGEAVSDERIGLEAADRELAVSQVGRGVLSGGSTPTAGLGFDGLTELRPGVYAFNDAQQLELGTCGWTEVALAATTTVVSRRGHRVIVDAGSKVLGADWPNWVTGGGRVLDIPDARVVALSEHHTTVDIPDGTPVPKYGDRLRVVPNHVCAAVNLADELVIVQGELVKDRWPVAARGANT
jgi:D-serine deaminase-like pyridoxal phosphate-dependent protein